MYFPACLTLHITHTIIKKLFLLKDAQVVPQLILPTKLLHSRISFYTLLLSFINLAYQDSKKRLSALWTTFYLLCLFLNYYLVYSTSHSFYQIYNKSITHTKISHSFRHSSVSPIRLKSIQFLTFIRVKYLRRCVSGSSTTCVLLFVVPSLVNIVRPGFSRCSGNAIPPSEKYTYALTLRSVQFFAPFNFLNFSIADSSK